MNTWLARSPRRSLWLAVMAALWAPTVLAVTTTWVKPGDGDWETAANWSAGVPKAADLVIVTPQKRSVLTLNGATTIAGLSMSNASLVTQADLTVTGGVNWTDDTAQAPSLQLQNLSTVRFQGSVTLGGKTAKGLNNTGVLELSGSTTWSGNTVANGNSLTVGINTTGTVLRNRGVFTDANTVDTGITGRATFDNQGNFTKTGASATRIDVATFLNSGSVTVAAGTLVLPAMTGVHSGSWQVDAGAVIDFAGGTPTLLGTLGGSGTLRFSGGTVTVEGFGHNVPMLLDGGSLAGGYQVFDGPVTWRTGKLAGSGTTLLTGALTLEGNGSQVIDAGRQVISYGQTIWSSATQLTVGQPGALNSSFVNLGEFRDAGLGALQGQSSDLSSFVNAGTYVKTGSGATIVRSLAFDNQGTLDIRSGLIRSSATVTNSGLIQTATGSGLLVTGGGPLENTGTLAGDGAIAIASSIINRGLISPGGPIGTLDLGDITLAPEGTLRMDIGAGGAHDLLLTDTVALGGTLDLWSSGAALQAGDSITLLQFNARQGTSGFDAIQFHGFGTQLAFDVLYGSGDVRLVVSAIPVPEPAAATLWLAGLALMSAVALRRR